MPKKTKKKNSKNHIYLGLGCLAFVISFLNLFLFNKPSNQVLGTHIIKTYSPSLTQEAEYWENIISKYPTYRDGYLELSDIYTKLGDISKANDSYNTAKNLDPNNLSF